LHKDAILCNKTSVTWTGIAHLGVFSMRGWGPLGSFWYDHKSVLAADVGIDVTATLRAGEADVNQ
jgi:hypothetical protein